MMQQELIRKASVTSYQILSSGSTEESTSGGVPILKLLIIGDAGVGKSCLLWRFTDDIYEDSYISTLGMDFKTKNLQISRCGKNRERKQWVRLQVWDTAGQEKFRTITSTYYRGAHGAVIVYAVNNRRSFMNVNRWLSGFYEYAEKDTPVILVGAKCDLDESEREVSRREGEELAGKFGCMFFETSAKTNDHVVNTFADIAENMYLVHQKRVEEGKRREKGSSRETSEAPDFEAFMSRKQRKMKCFSCNI